jgi:hypothetical protein
VAADALDALTALGEFASAKEGKDTKKLSREALGSDNALQWFFTRDAQNYVKGHADKAMSTVFGFDCERWLQATHSSLGLRWPQS